MCVGELSLSVNISGREKCGKCLHTQSVSKPFFKGFSILGFSILVTRVVLQLNYRIFRGKIAGFHIKEVSCKEPSGNWEAGGLPWRECCCTEWLISPIIKLQKCPQTFRYQDGIKGGIYTWHENMALWLLMKRILVKDTSRCVSGRTWLKRRVTCREIVFLWYHPVIFEV